MAWLLLPLLDASRLRCLDRSLLQKILVKQVLPPPPTMLDVIRCVDMVHLCQVLRSRWQLLFVVFNILFTYLLSSSGLTYIYINWRAVVHRDFASLVTLAHQTKIFHAEVCGADRSKSLRSPRSSHKVSPDWRPPFKLIKEQTTETMDPSPKTIGLRHYPANEILELIGAARLPRDLWGFALTPSSFFLFYIQIW